MDMNRQGTPEGGAWPRTGRGMEPRYIGTWRITGMEAWDADYINLAGPGYLKIDRQGRGSMQFGVVEAALDCRVEEIGSIQRLEFTFQGIDEEEAISGRGWSTVSGDEMTGRICFHRGEASGFTATKETLNKASARSGPKVIRLSKQRDTARVRTSSEGKTRQKIRYRQPVTITFSEPERALLEEHTFMDPDYTDRLQPAETGATLVGHYTLDDLEDMIGYIAAEANHTADKKLQRKLQSLFSRLQHEMESYDDGAWQQPF